MFVATRKIDFGRGGVVHKGDAVAATVGTLRALIRGGSVEEVPDGPVEYRATSRQRFGAAWYEKGHVVPGASEFRNLQTLVRYGLLKAVHVEVASTGLVALDTDEAHESEPAPKQNRAARRKGKQASQR